MVTYRRATLDLTTSYCPPMMPTVKYGEAYRGALKLQRLIMEDAPDKTGKELAAIAGSFVKLEMLKLRIRMRPAPKPIDVSKPKKSVLPSATMEE